MADEESTAPEGVEDEETMVLLEDMGCEYLQGFHISRPINKANVEKWLLDHS